MSARPDQVWSAPPIMHTHDRYNYDHFRTTHLLGDAVKTVAGVGIQPGQLAPEFALPLVSGGVFRLSDHLYQPLLLRFGSYS